MTSAASAASTPTAPTTAAAPPATSPSACATAPGSSTACSTARPARPASPSARARPCSAPGCPRTSSYPSWPTSPTAAASVRPPAWPASARTPSAASACSPASTPADSMTSWRAFPPSTTKVQLDEKWAFVHKKQRHCDPDDEADWFCGDQWDHVAFDPESRLVLSVVVGKRLAENAVLLLEDVRQRLGGRVPELVTSDEYGAYPEALLTAFGREVVPPRTGKPGRPAGPRLVPPE